MYQPAHFEQTDRAALQALVREFPLAMLITLEADGTPCADPVPMLLEGGDAATPHGVLRGHVARANPLWRRAHGRPVLAVFQGPQAYVSPSWYAAKREHGKVVPTWNYALVQARGTLAAIEDAAWLRALVGRLTERHEGARAEPWHVEDAPADYVAQMLRAIVGIEIPLDSLIGKWKVSQNRGAADREGTAQGLRAEGHDTAQALATLVDEMGRPR
jgi:transcriptional regulator